MIRWEEVEEVVTQTVEVPVEVVLDAKVQSVDVKGNRSRPMVEAKRNHLDDPVKVPAAWEPVEVLLQLKDNGRTAVARLMAHTGPESNALANLLLRAAKAGKKVALTLEVGRG